MVEILLWYKMSSLHSFLLYHFLQINVKKTRAQCPFSCNLVALLEDYEDAKITGKIHVSSNFRGSTFKNFAGEQALDPLTNMHLRTGPFSSRKEYCFIKCFILGQSA